MTGHTARVRALAVLPGPDERTLLASAGDDGTVLLWDAVTGHVARCLHTSISISALAWAGSLLVIGSDEGMFAVAVDIAPRDTQAPTVNLAPLNRMPRAPLLRRLFSRRSLT
jgi:WD40 repeat protein